MFVTANILFIIYLLNNLNWFIMTDSERLKEAFVYTKNQRYVRNQQDFTERLGIDKASMSQMINGHRSIANEVFTKIANTFPFFSILRL